MRQLILLFPLACVFLACPNGIDTCQVLGKTFVSVKLDTTTGLALNILTLDTLPEAYFEEASLVRLNMDKEGNTINDLSQGSNIDLSTSNKLNIKLSSPNNLVEEVGISIRYPDRQDFIDCEHPGSGDQYVLLLYFNYLPDGRVEDFRWVEDFRPGGF